MIKKYAVCGVKVARSLGNPSLCRQDGRELMEKRGKNMIYQALENK